MNTPREKTEVTSQTQKLLQLLLTVLILVVIVATAYNFLVINQGLNLFTNGSNDLPKNQHSIVADEGLTDGRANDMEQGSESDRSHLTAADIEDKLSELGNAVLVDGCVPDTGLYILYADTTLSFFNIGTTVSLQFSHQEGVSSEVKSGDVFDVKFVEPNDSIIVFCDDEELMEIEVLPLPDEVFDEDLM